jgi:Leucine-rich repeat (LRR) protein
MFRIALILSMLFTMLAAQEQSSAPGGSSEYGDDIKVVRTILDKCGLEDVSVTDVAKIEEGRVVSLNLNNKDVSKDGFSVLPPEIGQLTALRSLSCKGNTITSLPPEIGNLTLLEKLDANSNKISALPAEIGKLENLKDLDLRHNGLETLPDEIGGLKKLEFLRLWGNKLTSLTSAITELTSLKELYLKDNRLSTLPVGITNMKLAYIDLIGNKLCKLDPKIEAWMIKLDNRYKETQKCW